MESDAAATNPYKRQDLKWKHKAFRKGLSNIIVVYFAMFVNTFYV